MHKEIADEISGDIHCEEHYGKPPCPTMPTEQALSRKESPASQGEKKKPGYAPNRTKNRLPLPG